MNQKIGRFRIWRPMIEREPAVIRSIMARMIVVRAELRWDTDSIEYVALCDDFDLVEQGFIAPEYEIEIHSEEGFQRFIRLDQSKPSLTI